MREIGAAIIVAGFLIAVSIAITFRYSIVPIGAGRLGAYRLNHWTGEIVWCLQNSGSRTKTAVLPTLTSDTRGRTSGLSFGFSRQLLSCSG
jgi:hypothetical protein